jgi:hypothetical protein
MSNPTKPKKPTKYNSCATKKFPKEYKCKALQESHNNHPKSTASGEEFSFKAPPKMSFAKITAHVLPRNMITSRELTNPANGPRTIFKWTE